MSRTWQVLLTLIGIFLVIWAVAVVHQNQQPNTQLEGQVNNVPTDWKVATDTVNHVAFRYPEKLQTTYTHPVDWPPTIQLVNATFSCTEAGSETAQAGKTEKRSIAGDEYCVTTSSEGAAGSIYTMYAYAFPYVDKTAILTFSLQAVQCGNYDEGQKQACEKERQSFTVDPVIDLIAQSFVAAS